MDESLKIQSFSIEDEIRVIILVKLWFPLIKHAINSNETSKIHVIELGSAGAGREQNDFD